MQVAVAVAYQNADGDPAARASSKLAVREAMAERHPEAEVRHIEVLEYTNVVFRQGMMGTSQCKF